MWLSLRNKCANTSQKKKKFNFASDNRHQIQLSFFCIVPVCRSPILMVSPQKKVTCVRRGSSSCSIKKSWKSWIKKTWQSPQNCFPTNSDHQKSCSVDGGFFKKERSHYFDWRWNQRTLWCDGSRWMPSHLCNTPPSLVKAYMAGGRTSVFKSKRAPKIAGKILKRLFAQQSNLMMWWLALQPAASLLMFKADCRQPKKKASTILLTCNPAISKKSADVVIALNTGPEVIAGSTRLKAGTATKLVLNMLTVTSMVQMGKVFGNPHGWFTTQFKETNSARHSAYQRSRSRLRKQSVRSFDRIRRQCKNSHPHGAKKHF